MSKYSDYYNKSYGNLNDDDDALIKSVLLEGEGILWMGKPKRIARLLNSICSGIFPVAIIWLLFDSAFIALLICAEGSISEIPIFLIPFFAFHRMPVWIWLFGVSKELRRYKGHIYAVTDERIIVKKAGCMFEFIHISDVYEVSTNRSSIDRITGVGDVHISARNVGNKVIYDIVDYAEVAFILQRKVSENMVTLERERRQRLDSVQQSEVKCEPMSSQAEVYMTDTNTGDESVCENSNSRTQYVINDEFVNETTDYNMF